MAWFRRDKSVNEARDYLRATDAVSRPMAAILSFATIVVLVIFFFLVFMLVRWGYNEVFGDDEVVVVPTSEGGESTTGQEPPAGSKPADDNQLEFPGFISQEEADRIAAAANGQGSLQQTGTIVAGQSTVPSVGATTTAPITIIPDTGPGTSE